MDITTIIRPTTPADFPELDRIYDSARAFMRASGNMSQWRRDYPSSATAAEDMKHDRSFVIATTQGVVVATFCLMMEREPTYAGLEGEADEPYVTLHRVASDGTISGILDAATAFAIRRAPGCDIRIDTHADNAPMLAALARRGFIPTGPITLADGSPRLSFRLTLR